MAAHTPRSSLRGFLARLMRRPLGLPIFEVLWILMIFLGCCVGLILPWLARLGNAGP
jgi:hypothetical protein